MLIKQIQKKMTTYFVRKNMLLYIVKRVISKCILSSLNTTLCVNTLDTIDIM